MACMVCWCGLCVAGVVFFRAWAGLLFPPFGVLLGVVGVLSGLALMESLILAQDERWRRA